MRFLSLGSIVGTQELLDLLESYATADPAELSEQLTSNRATPWADVIAYALALEPRTRRIDTSKLARFPIGADLAQTHRCVGWQRDGDKYVFLLRLPWIRQRRAWETRERLLATMLDSGDWFLVSATSRPHRVEPGLEIMSDFKRSEQALVRGAPAPWLEGGVEPFRLFRYFSAGVEVFLSTHRLGPTWTLGFRCR